MNTLKVIPIQYVAQVWPSVEPMLARTEKFNETGDYNLDQIKMYVTTGQWALVMVTDEHDVKGAAVISFINYPNSRIAFITCAAGKDVFNRETIDELYRIVVDMGATKMQAAGRPSVVRLLGQSGFEPLTTVMEFKR
jgi:hypothetical protein